MQLHWQTYRSSKIVLSSTKGTRRKAGFLWLINSPVQKAIYHVWNEDVDGKNHLENFFDDVLSASNTHFIYYAAEEHTPHGENADICSNKNRVNLRKALKDRVENHRVKVDIVFGRTLQFEHNEVWNDLKPYVTLHSWTTYFAIQQLREQTSRYQKGEILLNNPKPRKLFALKQNKSHDHRCILMDELARVDPRLIKDNLVTWVEPTQGSYAFDIWDEEQLIFEDIDSNFNFNYHDPPGYFDCLFDVVSESTSSRLFYTEKTFKAIMLKRPFVIYGGKDINAVMAETFGLELFPELFDYEFEKYDDITNRAKHLAQQLGSYTKYTSDWERLHQLVQGKVERNFHRMWQICLDTKHIPDIVHDFSHYREFIQTLTCIDKIV